MINEKISLRIWIEAAADQGVPLHTYLLKLSSEELELSEDAILEQMQAMLQVMEESAAFGLTGVSSHSGLTGGAAKKLQEARQSENYKNILGGDGTYRRRSYRRSQRRSAGSTFGIEAALQFERTANG